MAAPPATQADIARPLRRRRGIRASPPGQGGRQLGRTRSGGATAPRQQKHLVVAAAAAARQGRCAPAPKAFRPPTSPNAKGEARLAESAPPSSQRESGDRKTFPPSASPRPPTTTGAGEDARRAPAARLPPIGPCLIRRRRRRRPKILQRRRRAPEPRRRRHPVAAAAAAVRQGLWDPTPKASRLSTSSYARGDARLAEPALPSSQRESDDGKTSSRRCHRAR